MIKKKNGRIVLDPDDDIMELVPYYRGSHGKSELILRVDITDMDYDYCSWVSDMEFEDFEEYEEKVLSVLSDVVRDRLHDLIWNGED